MFEFKETSKFSSKDMLEYLVGFNYLKEKYLIDDSLLLKKLAQFERFEQQGRLQKMPPSYIGKTVNNVYGLSYNTKMQTIQNFSIVWRKIINEFLNIKGLELLFNEHYYDFEWDMHLEIDFEKASPTYYRDHMEHQIRNMYMMMVLLDDYGFLKVIKNVLLNKTNSKVSEYVKNRYNSFIEKSMFNNEREEVLLDCAKCYFCNQIKVFISSNESYKKAITEKNNDDIVDALISFFEAEDFLGFNQKIKDSFLEFFKIEIDREGKVLIHRNKAFSYKNLKIWIESIDPKILIRSYLETYSIYYIVRSAAMISALFHDISYPICFFLNMRRRVGQYLPSMNAFVHNLEADIDRIVSLLQPSLLFVLVSESEIRAKLAKNQKKYDHGVLSAIALLLSFYESGRIHQLPIDKQIAIELAALAIYNHNFSYYINETDKKEYYRPVFQQNPISYLLKVCDDMQEWDRRYFELSEKNSFTYCPNCLSPIVKVQEYDDENVIKESLFCGCKGKKYAGAKFFPSRNMYIVTTCESINVCANNKNNGTNLIFKLNYNLLDLLYMSQISSSYSTYRANELGKLKILLLNQKYYDQDNTRNKIDNIYLDYTMSNNPIFLKSKIILSYILESLKFKTNDFNKNMDKIQVEVNNTFSQCVELLDNILAKENYSDCDPIQFFEIFKLKVVELLKDNFLPKLIKKEKLLFSFWIYSLFNDINSQEYNLLWDLFCKRYSYMCPSGELKELFETIKTTKWNELSKAINDVIKENCCALLIKRVVKLVPIDSSQTSKQKVYRKKLVDLLENKTYFYLELSGYIMKSFVNVSLLPKEKDFINAMFSLKFVPYDGEQSGFTELITDLLKDMYAIISNQVDIYGDVDFVKYKTQYIPKKNMPHIVGRYCNPANWYENNPESYTKFVFRNLDYHSDLIIFEVLGNII